MFVGGRTSARRAAAALCLIVASVSVAGAQTPSGPAAHAPSFIPRTDFSFLWASLVTPDPRFTWAARLRFDADLVDYGTGRFTLVMDYEAILGSERKRFDLNHGNYAIEGSLSQRLGQVTVAAFFHHVSRHLSDRDDLGAISWNVVGVQAARSMALGRAILDVRIDVGQVRGQHSVDYTWTTNLHVAVQRPINAHSAAFARVAGGFMGVDREVFGRGHQLCGAGVEAGVRLTGRDGAVELIAGYERRMDAYPMDLGRVRMFMLGFRLVSR